MNEQTSKNKSAASRPAITLMMVLCGLVGAVSMGAANAATADDGVTHVVVRYQPASLSSDSGTRALYRRLVNAAAEACPASAGTRFVSGAVQQCRDQALARAVHQIGSPALAALHAGSSKKG